MTEVEKNVKIEQLRARLNLLKGRDRDNAGVCRKLERQIRNLERA